MLPHTTPLDIVILIVSMILSLTIHEFMHGYVAHLLGDSTARDEGRLTLNPLRHIDLMTTILLPIVTIIVFGVPLLAAKPVPFNPSRLKFGDYGSALVSAAGPLSNLVLAFIAALIFRGIGGSGVVYDIFDIFIVLNVAMFVFNIIPIPPLDGSRVLYAFAPDAVRELFDRIEPFGIIIVFLLVLYTGASGLLVNIENFFLRILP